MYMTPTRRMVDRIIAMSVLVETDFENTYPQLVSLLSNWEATYKTYVANIRMYMDYLSNLDNTKYIWSLIPSDVNILLQAWFRVNILINYFSNYLSPIPDSMFVHKDLTNAGITYIDIYGSSGDLSSDATVVTGKFTEIVSKDEVVDISIRSCGRSYLYDDRALYLYQLQLNDDGNLTNDDYKSAEFMTTNSTSCEFIHPYTDAYQDGLEYFRLTEPCVYGASALAFTHVFPTGEEITSQARLDAAREKYGTIYYGDGTTRALYVTFDGGTTMEYIGIKCADEDMSSGVMIETDYIGATYYAYKVDDEYFGFYAGTQAVFNAKKELYGTIYRHDGRYYRFKNAKIVNAYYFVVRELLPEIDPFEVTCLECGTRGVMKVTQDVDTKWIKFKCTNCENEDMETMSFPTVYYVGKTHPLHTYDPDFNWYETYTQSLSIHKQLICKKLWKGLFGTGSKYISTDLDYLPKVETIGDKAWDKKATTLANKFIEYTEDFDLALTLEGMKTKENFKKLYQLGNVFAIRHELIRVCYAVLKRLLKEGAGVEI